MKKKILLSETDLSKLIKKIIVENDNLGNHTGEYFTLGGLYFYVDNEVMCLADKKTGELSPNMSVEFPSTTEISAIWTQKTQEVDDENIKGLELANLDYDEKMKNAIKYGKYLYSKNEPMANFGSMQPILFFSKKFRRPALGGFVVGTEFPESVEGQTTIIDAKPGNKIFFQQSAFKKGKEFGIRLEVTMQGQPIDLKIFGISQNMLKLPKAYNIGDFFEENSANPRNLESASFIKTIKDFIKNGGKINKISVIASTSEIPAGYVDNDQKKSKWKDISDYDNVVVGNNDDGTGNLRLTKAKAFNTYSHIKKLIPELASVPYILKADGHSGEYVHVKFE